VVRSRKLPFDDFQEFMYGRVYLSPSRLYSVVRLSPDRAAYDVPVDGDWVTIAVVAERGQVQISRRGGKDKDKAKGKWGGAGDKDKDGKPAEKNDEEDEESMPAPKDKKYMRLLLVDFGHRASEGKSTPKEQLKGDALLNMLLFEADSARAADGGNGKGKDVIYKGGSGGAFEACAKLREGAILAILNPRVLKPFQVCVSHQTFPSWLIALHSAMPGTHILVTMHWPLLQRTQGLLSCLAIRGTWGRVVQCAGMGSLAVAGATSTFLLFLHLGAIY
jgi:hypothetical protein